MAQPVYSSDNPFAAKARSGSNRSYFSRRAQAWEKEQKEQKAKPWPKSSTGRAHTSTPPPKKQPSTGRAHISTPPKPSPKKITPNQPRVEATVGGAPMAPKGGPTAATTGFLSERAKELQENLGKAVEGGKALAGKAVEAAKAFGERYKGNVKLGDGSTSSTVAKPAEAGRTVTGPSHAPRVEPKDVPGKPAKSSPNKTDPHAPRVEAKPAGSVAKPATTTSPGTTASPAAKPASTVVKPKGEGAKPKNVDKIAVKPQTQPHVARVEARPAKGTKYGGMSEYLKSHGNGKGGMPWPKDGKDVKDAPARPEAGKAWKDRAHRKDTMVWDKHLGRMTDRGVSGLKRERMK